MTIYIFILYIYITCILNDTVYCANYLFSVANNQLVLYAQLSGHKTIILQK